MTMINTARPYTQNFGKLPFQKSAKKIIHTIARKSAPTRKKGSAAFQNFQDIGVSLFSKLDKPIEKQMIKLHGSKEKYYAHLQKSWDREIAIREFMTYPVEHIKAFIAKYRGKA